MRKELESLIGLLNHACKVVCIYQGVRWVPTAAHKCDGPPTGLSFSGIAEHAAE